MHMIKLDRIGHVVLKVRDLERSTAFYTGVLGMDVMSTGTYPGGLTVRFLATNRRDHHELALMEVGPDAEDPPPTGVGLAHFAFRVPDQDALQDAYRELKDLGVPVQFTVNHGVCNAVYLTDPDGHQLEVYADNPKAEWETMDNPYEGLEGLPFASADPSLRDVMTPTP
jgi:catechol 2,3-dioxygenase